MIPRGCPARLGFASMSALPDFISQQILLLFHPLGVPVLHLGLTG
jgi:hypothetical protein